MLTAANFQVDQQVRAMVAKQVLATLGIDAAGAGAVITTDGAGGASPVTPVSTPTLGYALPVLASSHDPVASETVYFGSMPAAPSTTAVLASVYVPADGTVSGARIQGSAAVAGTGEDWSLYLRLNNATDHLIATVASTSAGRVWLNAGLSVAVVAGDLLEVKAVHPSWATPPSGVTYGGVVYVV